MKSPLKNIEQTLGKSCLIGLSYFDVKGNILKQTMLAGKATAVDKELGITLSLFSDNNASSVNNKLPNKSADFIIPSDLSCWFVAPKGEFHTSQANMKIKNPDYLITWDIQQTKQKHKDSIENNDGQHQWWQWRPNTKPPQIG